MTARHHHYLSQCYLKGFTKAKAKKSKLTVIDFKQNKHFETIPRNVGGIRDFNRINAEGHDPNAIEKELAQFEAKAAFALKRLEESLNFQGETKDLVLNLIALIAVRSPERREHLREFEARVMDRVLGMSLRSKEYWEEQEAARKAKNPDYKSDVTYEELKEFYDGKQYKIKLSTERHIEMEMVQVNSILPCLYGRNWILIKSGEQSGPFITSDNPVSLTWNEPEQIPLLYRNSPGFGLKNTMVYFPISKDLALVGEFDKEDKTINGVKKLVSILNTKTLQNIYKQVYTPNLSFNVFGEDGEIYDGRHILRELNA